MEGQAGTTRQVGETGQSPGEGVEPGRAAEVELVKGGKKDLEVRLGYNR